MLLWLLLHNIKHNIKANGQFVKYIKTPSIII